MGASPAVELSFLSGMVRVSIDSWKFLKHYDRLAQVILEVHGPPLGFPVQKRAFWRSPLTQRESALAPIHLHSLAQEWYSDLASISSQMASGFRENAK